jgi:nanoRNase/pAp phosphatase (c-di-AMP/oligoRNAs hydrolase)
MSVVEGREVSFSARMRPPLDRKLHLHLGVLMQSLAKIINGTGGGHPCAAGAYGPLTSKGREFEDKFRERILDLIRSNPR